MDMQRVVEDLSDSDRGPSIWFGSNDFVSRLDHPEYTSHLASLNMRDLRIIQALLECAIEHVTTAMNKRGMGNA